MNLGSALKAKVLRLLLESDGLLPYSEIVEALQAQSQAGAVQVLLSELCAAGIVERRGTGRYQHKRYAYRILDVPAAQNYLRAQANSQGEQRGTRRRLIARALTGERERVEEWFAATTWDAPAREAFMAYYRGELRFAELARVLEREGFPEVKRRRSAR